MVDSAPADVSMDEDAGRNLTQVFRRGVPMADAASSSATGPGYLSFMIVMNTEEYRNQLPMPCDSAAIVLRLCAPFTQIRLRNLISGQF
jgi:hypothetical protein